MNSITNTISKNFVNISSISVEKYYLITTLYLIISYFLNFDRFNKTYSWIKLQLYFFNHFIFNFKFISLKNIWTLAR